MATFPLTTLIYDSSFTSNIRSRTRCRVPVSKGYRYGAVHILRFFSRPSFVCILICSSLPFQAVIHSYYTHLSSMMELNSFAFI